MRNQKGMTLIEIMLAMTTLSIVCVMFLQGIMMAAKIQARVAINKKNLIQFNMLESALDSGLSAVIDGVDYDDSYAGREVQIFVETTGNFTATGTFIKMWSEEEGTENFQRIVFVHDPAIY